MIDYSIEALVSVIIPFYNNEDTLIETLQSIESQTHNNLEVILIEDLNSRPICRELYASLNLNISFYKNTLNKGASSNRNFGLKKAKGQYIQFLDADDLLSKDKIFSQIKLLNGSNFNIAICKWTTFENNLEDNKINNSILYRDWQKREYLATINGTFSELMPIHSYLIPIFLIKKTEGWDENISLGDDGEFMNRVIVNTGIVLFSNQGLAYYRRGNKNSLSHSVDEKAVESSLLCATSYENVIQCHFYADKFMVDSVLRKYNLLFLWAYKKFPKIAVIAESRIKILGGKLNMRIGSKSTRFVQWLLGTKRFITLSRRLLNK
jgi:glycosyltransferase involved in cell wall biosynthesis